MVAIETRYLGPTNTKGARIVATAQTRNRIVIPWFSSLGHTENHARAAKALRSKLDWNGLMVGGGTKLGMAWVFINNPETSNMI